MRFTNILFLLFHLCISSLSAPTSTTADPSASSSSISSSSHATSSSTASKKLTIIHPHPPSPSHHPSGKSPIHGPGRLTPHPTRTRPHTITITPTSTEQQHRHDDHHSPQKPINIFFEVLGGLVGLAILISCIRCCYSYNRTPKRDRIAAVLQRHQLQRELEELERNPFTLRRSPSNDPVPPYFPPPPTYEVITSTNPASSPPQHSGYLEISTASPPPSPPSPTLQLEPAHSGSTIRHLPIPPPPNG